MVSKNQRPKRFSLGNQEVEVGSCSDVLFQVGSSSIPFNLKMSFSIGFKAKFFGVLMIFIIQVGGRQIRDRFEEDFQCPNANKDLSWFRQNAKSLLFMEHLQNRASEEDLYDWSKFQQTDRFQSRLRTLENQFILPEEIPDDCYEQMPIPQRISQRISFLEDRLEGCGSSQSRPCRLEEDVDDYSGGAMRRLSILQAELLRQRNVIRQLRTSMASLTQKCEGQTIHFFKS